MAKSGTANFYNGVATTSVRFGAGSKTYLQRTITTGNRRLFTYSFWLKRTGISSLMMFMSKGTNIANADITEVSFTNADQIQLREYNDDVVTHNLITTRVFRDTNAWYNIVIAFDTAQGTNTNRVKIYVNGVQETSFGTAAYPDQNYDSLLTYTQSGSSILNIGAYSAASAHYFKGYMSDVTHIDGAALSASSFGETKNGVWIPIDTSGLTFGDEGYLLKLNQVGVGTASSSTIGADISGNTNHFTSSGIVASDCAMPDSPENNFCVMNSNSPAAGTRTFSGGNLRNTHSGNAYSLYSSTFGVKTGKWYAEMRFDSNSTSEVMMYGLSNAPFINGNAHTTAATIWYISDGAGYVDGSAVAHGAFSGSVSWGTHATTSPGFVMGIALDLDSSTKTVTFTKDGGDSFSKDLPASFTDHIHFCVNKYSASSGTAQWTWNFGQDSTFAGQETATSNADGNGFGAFHTAPASGYLALCSANLPEPTIGANSGANEQADDYFETVLWTGNDTDDTAIAVNFKPDFTWIKQRSSTAYHNLSNSTVGATKALFSNATDAEGTNSDRLKAFTSTGFTLGDASDVNASSNTYVAWNWKVNGGTTATNNDGDGTSTVQANTTAGFSIVTYTGSSNESYGHGLDSAPEMILVKARNYAHNWAVYHQGLQDSTANGFLELNTTAAKQTGSQPRFLNGTTSTSQPTSTVFNVNHFSGSSTNASNNSDIYVAFCFHSVEGYSKFGSFVANNSANGVFVYLGFRPAFFILKDTTTAGSWSMYDSVRDTINPAYKELSSDASGAETTNAGVGRIDFLSNGFKIRDNDGGSYMGQEAGAVFIYMAFADQPFKYANAR